MTTDNINLMLAKQAISELKHLYARATDLIGRADDASVAEGRAIYHRIFAGQARIGAAHIDPVIGPDAWADVVLDALKHYGSTQHLIGTQLIEVASLSDNNGTRGEATMLSYVQAWHSTDDEVWLFMGAYHDKLTHTASHGWRISEMILEQMDIDRRARRTAPSN